MHRLSFRGWIVKAVVNLSLGGERIGAAAASVLTGAVNPSGKLAESYPLKPQDIYPQRMSMIKTLGRCRMLKAHMTGCRYYDKAKVPVAFPFGFGLSYTSFALKNIRLSSDHVTDDQPLTISLQVITLDRLMVRKWSRSMFKNNNHDHYDPEKSLKAFKKVFVKAGQAVNVALELKAQPLGWREQTQTWVLPEAQKAIAVGTSVTNIDAVLPVSFTGETFNNFATIPNWYTTLSGKPSVQDF